MDSDPEPCAICKRPATEYYADRDDCPCCGSASCGLKIQGGLDYTEDRG